MSPTTPNSYNLRHSPTRTPKAQSLTTYITTTRRKASTSSPRTRYLLNKQISATLERVPQIPFPTIFLANEIVSGGRPPTWHIARHQLDLFDEWDRAMGHVWGMFERGREWCGWVGMGCWVECPRMTFGGFGRVDLEGGEVQGRSLVAKRIEGREVGPGRAPGVEEMSWREWRRVSRAAGLLLEAVNGVPWGWEMSDEEWEEFSKPDQKCNYNRSNDPDELLKLWRWEHHELW